MARERLPTCSSSSSSALRSANRALRDQTGAVAVILGLMLLPVFGFAGAALDYTRASNERSLLQAAADAASLAGAHELEGSRRDVESAVRNYLDANLPERYQGIPFSVQILNDNTTVQVTLESTLDTTVLGAVGIKTVDIGVLSEATLGGRGVELALVLDVTGSMRDHMHALRRGAKSLVDTVFNGKQVSKEVHISLVPYVATVNVGAHPRHMQWMDVNGNARWHGQNFENIHIQDERCYPPPPPRTSSPSRSSGSSGSSSPPPPPPPQPWSPDLGMLEGDAPLPEFFFNHRGLLAAALGLVTPGAAHAQGMGGGSWPYGTLNENTPVDCNRRTPAKVNHFDLFQAMSGVRWGGCVEARPEPYDTTDTPPNPGNPDTLWVPYLWPDERDGHRSIRVDYLPDRAGMPSWVRNRNDARLRRAWVWKYREGKPSVDESAFIQQSPNAACPDPIVALTNQRNTLTRAIDNLRSYGGSGTNSALGLAWGWRTLSPNEPFSEGVPYGTKDHRKIIVLMTDGMNEVVPQGNNWNRSDYTAYGYADNARLGTTNIGRMRERIDEKLVEVCNNVKAEDITIYTVMFEPFVGALDDKIKKIFQDCASREANFIFAKNQQQLVDAFDRIAKEITALRLSR